MLLSHIKAAREGLGFFFSCLAISLEIKFVFSLRFCKVQKACELMLLEGPRENLKQFGGKGLLFGPHLYVEISFSSHLLLL